MHSYTRIVPLQLFCILTFVFLLLHPPFSNGAVAKHGCQDRCGDLMIPYPFGIGRSCSFDPFFDITCNGSAVSPKAYLTAIDREVMEINDTYIRVKYPNLVSVCYDLSGGTGTIVMYEQNMSMNLSGTPYTFSSAENVLTAIGCDDMVMQSNGSWASGGCSAFCADKNDTGGLGYCARNGSLLASGCCHAEIHTGTVYGISDGKGFVAAELIDLSGNIGRRKLFPCSYAFIQERRQRNESEFSFPLYYLDNSTAFLIDNWASTTKPPVVMLGWSIGSKGCSHAQLNSTTYACQDNKSICIDFDYDYDVEYTNGYICSCVEGYEGNPYLRGGCQAISFSSSIARSGCPDQCGEVSIPFPFGVGSNCYLEPFFEIICNASTNPPTPYLPILKAEVIELKNTSQVLVRNYLNSAGFACYNLSDNQQGITKPQEHSLIIDLSRTQYTLSEGNMIYAIGCDDMVTVTVRQANTSFLSSSCSSLCWEPVTGEQSYEVQCPVGSEILRDYYDSSGCCRAAIPRDSNFLKAILSDLSAQRKQRKFSNCSYVLLNYEEYPDGFGFGTSMYMSFNNLHNSTMMQIENNLQKIRGSNQMMLDWRIGQGNCKEAMQDPKTFACQANSDCVDFDSNVGGYQCNCSSGYRGNPYLNPGCQDIDECADSTTNPCDSISSCNNTQGSVNCICPKGYYGDGRKDGTRCIPEPHAKTKMIILTGIGSGLGFLLFILIIFWLYKVLQKRKEKLLRDKFFKRNGGLLLRQQTNEGALGKTKVFPANELVVATDNFNENRILGQGGQGTVYKGMLSDGKIVAIKKSKMIEENQLQQFINEVVILSQINHRNIVKLLGCCLETEVPLLVYEFMPNGTLFDLIHDTNNEFPFTWDMRVKIAADIAGALAYLHSASSMPIYHRDIKSSNILLDEKYVIKVSDFGTSRSVSVDQTHLTTMVKGTFGYLDPEYFQSSQFTEKSDVYSYGVVLAELLTGQKPISFDKTEEERGLATRFLASMEDQDLFMILDPQVSQQSRKEEVILVARLAQRCLNLKGKMRPSMKEVAIELEGFRIPQIPTGAADECEEATNLEDLPTVLSNNEYTWTTSYKSSKASSSDTHPLMFTSE